LSLPQETSRREPGITIQDVQAEREPLPLPVQTTEQEPVIVPLMQPVTERMAATTDPVPVPVEAPRPEPIVAPPPPDPALVAAVRAHLAGDAEAARKHLGNSRSAATLGTQEELLALLSRLQERDVEQLPTEDAGKMLALCEHLARTIQGRAPLLLDSVCFCRRIKSFGVYDPLPADAAFQAGTQGQPGERVCVYAEVRNVLTSKAGSWHEVALDGTLEIVDFKDQVAFRMDFPATPDRSRSPRTDCYVGYEFNIPPNLPAGRYVLRIQVRDGAVRMVKRTLEFRVTGGETR